MRGAAAAFAREHCGRRPSRRTLALVAALCTLALFTSGIGPWQWRGVSRRCEPDASSPQPDGAPPADTASAEDAEPPDTAALAICTVMKVAADDPQWRDGRAEDVHEWLEHHRRLGVGRVYVFDHGSEVPLNDTLRNDTASGYVHYEYGTSDFVDSTTGGRQYPQLDAYKACLARFGQRHRYMAFIDADEYFVLTDRRPGAPATLPQLLDHYADIRPFGGFVVAWVVFGSSGHVKRPLGGVLASYVQCLPRGSIHSRHVKTIVNTAQANTTLGPHIWTFKDPFYAIDERFELVDEPIMPEGRGSVDKIALHHYVLKSLEDFKAKEKRGAGDGTQKTVHNQFVAFARPVMEFFSGIDALATVNCTTLVDSEHGPITP